MGLYIKCGKTQIHFIQSSTYTSSIIFQFQYNYREIAFELDGHLLIYQIPFQPVSGLEIK